MQKYIELQVNRAIGNHVIIFEFIYKTFKTF